MPHALFRRPTQRSPEEVKGKRIIQGNPYVGEVFVGRRKVWEGRYATEQEAFSAAKQTQDAKYKDANSNVQVRKTKAKGDA